MRIKIYHWMLPPARKSTTGTGYGAISLWMWRRRLWISRRLLRSVFLRLSFYPAKPRRGFHRTTSTTTSHTAILGLVNLWLIYWQTLSLVSECSLHLVLARFTLHTIGGNKTVSSYHSNFQLTAYFWRPHWEFTLARFTQLSFTTICLWKPWTSLGTRFFLYQDSLGLWHGLQLHH